MAFSQAQIDTLEAAIAEGALTVKYQDKQVTYRSLDEMLRIRNMMKKSLAACDCSLPFAVLRPSFSKGLCD